MLTHSGNPTMSNISAVFAAINATTQGRNLHAGCSGFRQIRHGGSQSKKH
jgi:hypothetical protein